MRDRRLQNFARGMRQEPTPAEQTLWLALRAERFQGVKFRRQKVIGQYIADFASRLPMLVIEVDGHSHGNDIEYEETRTQCLEALGYRVVRFTNSEVTTNLDGVLETLGRVIAQTPLPTLSPEGERA